MPEPPGMEEFAPDASCRGCGALLWRAAGGRWEDADGFTVCVKVPLADNGWSLPADYVFHQPMPHGLAGAPLT